MSIQETNLKAIADAIREKDGTTEPIAANDFAARILAIPSGGSSGGSDFAVPLVVTVDAGATVTAKRGDLIVTGISGAHGVANLTLTAPGEWQVSAELDGTIKGPKTVSIIEGYTEKFTMRSRLPEGYQEVEYIRSGSGQYINPQFPIKSSHNITIDLEVLQYPGGNPALFGWVGATKSGSTYSWQGGHSCFLYENGSASVYTSTYPQTFAETGSFNPHERLTCAVNATNKTASLIQGATEIVKDISVSSSSSQYTSYVLSAYRWANNGATAVSVSALTDAKLYSFKIESNGELAVDLVPCINPSGVVGVFDLVRETFYGSATSTPFTAGPSV